MKGLLLKDWYMITRYCRSLLLIDLVFIAVSLFAPGFVVFFAYPCLFAAIIPVTLYSYDEREKWHVYSAALPVSRAQLVSVKYIVGLLSEAAILLLTILIHEIARFAVPGNGTEYLIPVFVASAFSFVVPAVTLPLMFRFGAEKGRIGYYIMIGGLCAAFIVLLSSDGAPSVIETMTMDPGVLCAIALALYAASWGVSVALYKQREL